jgi:lipid-A-disaccharide synthase
MPVAPTLSLEELASYAHPENNPAFELVQGVAAQLIAGDTPYLETLSGTRVWLHQTVGDRIPPYGLLKQCQICLTTIGANTAELGALAVPMVVLLPTNQWDAMRAWNGVPGILANLPGVGTLFAKLINQWASRRLGLLAWPNKWAGKQIVPELLGKLYPATIADLLIDYLEHPAQLEAMRQALQAARGEPGAAAKLATIVVNLLQSPPPHQQ